MLLKAVSCTLNTPHLVHVERDHPCRQVYDGVLRDLSKGGGREIREKLKGLGTRRRREGRRVGYPALSSLQFVKLTSGTRGAVLFLPPLSPPPIPGVVCQWGPSFAPTLKSGCAEKEGYGGKSGLKASRALGVRCSRYTKHICRDETLVATFGGV